MKFDRLSNFRSIFGHNIPRLSTEKSSLSLSSPNHFLHGVIFYPRDLAPVTLPDGFKCFLSGVRDEILTHFSLPVWLLALKENTLIARALISSFIVLLRKCSGNIKRSNLISPRNGICCLFMTFLKYPIT